MSTLMRYTAEHEWMSLDGDVATIGITAHAQEQLGDIVFVELPEVGKQLAKGDEAAVVESVKAASEVYAPLDGEVTEVNEALAQEPTLVNSDPQGGGWFFRLKVANPAQAEGMLDEAAYNALIGG